MRSESHAVPTPTATPMTVSAKRRMGCCQASCGLSAATPMTTAVLIAAVSASPGRPMSVTARALSPMSAAMAQMLKGRKIR